MPCTYVCSSYGMTYDGLTALLVGAGSDGLGRCAGLVQELGGGGSSNIQYSGPPGGLGCMKLGTSVYIGPDTTNEMAYYSSALRVCACQ